MEFHQSSYTIDNIIKRIKTGKLALPDFQRDFVWNPDQVVELLDSVARQWPIGSLLILSGPQDFAFRSIFDGPRISNDKLAFYLLDGQQRMTSLYHAIEDVSDYCYYVDFKELDLNQDGFIKWERRTSFFKKYPDLSDRASKSLALISDIWSSERFYHWLSCQIEDKSKMYYAKLRETKLKGLNQTVYNMVAIDLEESIDLEALARIFETLNRTGVALNAFDLMVASLYPTGFNLREEFEKALNEYPILAEYNVSEIEILRLVAVITRLERGKSYAAGVRQGDLLKIRRQYIKEYWIAAVDQYAKTLEFVREQFGIVNPSLIPSWPMIICVAALSYHEKTEQKIILSWWKLRILDQYFSQAANTKIISEIDKIINNDLDSLLDSDESRGKFGAKDYFSEEFWINYSKRSVKSNGIFARGLMGFITNNGAIDILTGDPIKDTRETAFRTVDSNRGVIRKPLQNDTIESLIVLSKVTDKKMKKEVDIHSLPHGYEALRIQGITLPSLRGPEYIRLILDMNGEEHL